MLFFRIFLLVFCLFFPLQSFSHAGSHGNDDCLISIGNFHLRMNGYQFQGKRPDRHYCRYFPYLGQTILKLDTTHHDLSKFGVDLQLLKRTRWLALLFNPDQAFEVIKQKPLQNFSQQVVSIDTEIKSLDLYALHIKLHHPNGRMSQQLFLFAAGLPLIPILLGIATLLLILLGTLMIFRFNNKRQR